MKTDLPNFLIVGAAKSGTSSMHNYLNQHPEIFMPTFTEDGLKVKEPRFLIKEKVKKRLKKGVWNLGDYKSLFKKAIHEKAIGESTVLYLYYYKEAIKNIIKYLGKDVKIIIMLRNPIERAYSAYLFASRTHQENQSFKQALETSKERYDNNETLSPMILYKELGLYYEMVKSYIKNFKNVHIVLYDDFIMQTDTEVSRVFHFLNVNIDRPINTSRVINSGGMQWRSRLAKDFVMKDWRGKKMLRLLLPEFVRINLKEFLKNSFTRKADCLNESIRKELKAYYQEDIQLLEKLINKDLKKWLRI